MRVIFLKIFYPLLALSSFINPYYGVLNYAFITVIRPESLAWGGDAIRNVSFPAIVCLALASFIKGNIRWVILKKRFFVAFFLYYIFFYFVSYQSPTTYISQEHQFQVFTFIKQILLMFVFCLCMYSVINHDEKRVLIFINTLMLMFLFMAIWGIEQRTHGNALIEGLFGRAIVDRCAITGVFVLVIPLGLYNFIYPYNGKKIWKYSGLLSVFCFVLMVFFTDSRAGLLGFIFSMVILSISMKHKIRNMLILCLCLMTLYPFLPESYHERIQSIGRAKEGTEKADRSAGSRLVMWQAALIIIQDNPLFGVGNLNFPEVAYDNRQYFVDKISNELFEYTFQENFKLACHNMFLDIFAEGGVLTAVPFYVLMIIPIFNAFRLRKFGDDPENRDIFVWNRLLFFLLAGMMGYLVTCFFANMRFIDYYYWMLTLILIVGEILEKKVKQDSELKRSVKDSL